MVRLKFGCSSCSIRISYTSFERSWPADLNCSTVVQVRTSITLQKHDLQSILLKTCTLNLPM